MQYILDPQIPYERYFEDMTRIPHGSKNEKQYSDYLVEFAKARHLRYIQDELWNVIMYKPGTPGYEDHPPVILQAHIDMVCEKNLGSTHCFETDPLDLYLDGKWLQARDTTLGADDGVGVAYILSILDSDLPHPPLECLFTVQEECGLVGASALKSEYFQSRRLIGLDNVEGVSSYVSCADGRRYKLIFTAEKESADLPFYQLVISGLNGGHSGADIHKERANSIQFAARAMEEISRLPGTTLVASVNGGSKDNAIPRDCIVCFAASADREAILEAVQRVETEVRTEYRFSEENISFQLTDSTPQNVYSREDSCRLIQLLFVLPTGMEHRSMKIEDLATASENLGVIETNGNTTEIQYFIRAELESANNNMVRQIETLAKICGCETEMGNYSPGWAYMENSHLRDILQKTYTQIMGRPMEMIAVHGGLECGFFANLAPEMDIVTIGPLVEDYHTPRERLDRESFTQIYNVLIEMLRQL